jgi:hypothetical protein
MNFFIINYIYTFLLVTDEFKKMEKIKKIFIKLFHSILDFDPLGYLY